MNCKNLEIQTADYLVDQLTHADRRTFEDHLKECPDCRLALNTVQTGWNRMAAIPESEPSSEMRSRFYTMLAEEKVRGQIKVSIRSRLNGWLNRWWPKEPAVQFALTCGLVILTILFSGQLHTDDHQISALQEDVRNMRQTMSVSLLDQEAATDRLQGIQLIKQVSNPETSLLDQLIQHVNEDPNVNVRLAAVDALYLFSHHAAVRNQLAASLQNQASPMVQIALIDLMSDIRYKQAADALKSLVQDQTIEPDVRHHAQDRLNQMM